MDFVRLITKNTAKKWNVIPLLFSFTPFHQCGIVLCGVAIVSSSLLTKKSCGLLLKTGQVARRRNYEGLGERHFEKTVLERNLNQRIKIWR